MRNLYSLFLSQAYQDCWDDYNRSLRLRNFPKWDYVILTASNEQQAEGFRKQIEERKDFLPKETTFVAIPDRDGKRVGSGGATLEVLKYLHEQEETFDNLRVLVIHSGGDSKRVPQYSALGKLFSPVPHALPNGRNSTLFDEFMICMSSVPSRIREGMVLLSGDVLLLFNPLQIDYNNVGAAAISFKEHVETGKNHGVYLNGENGNPFDPFALQKACLLACGIIPKEGSSLEEILDRLGGGFEMHSEVTNVPKGSGLGTSSILSAACVKAVFEFMGIAYTEEDLYAHVLAMEQIMSTGGGWQDQVGGITPGLKYITSMPGIDQKLKVTHVEIPEAAKQELSDRFVLIYTGQRRLARNLLRDVVGRYVGNEPESLFALEEIQKTAALMRFELERGNVDGFASLLDYHWELSKKVDAGSSNTLIEQIFSSIEELIDGKLVCGAGGGGFLQVILKKGVTRQQVEERLNEVFMDSLVGVADCRLVWE